MRCFNIDANNRKRFYAFITFDAIIRNKKTQVNNVHCCKLAIRNYPDRIRNRQIQNPKIRNQRENDNRLCPNFIDIIMK